MRVVGKREDEEDLKMHNARVERREYIVLIIVTVATGSNAMISPSPLRRCGHKKKESKKPRHRFFLLEALTESNNEGGGV